MYGACSRRLVDFIGVNRPANAGRDRKFIVCNLFAVEVPGETGCASLTIRMKIEGDVDLLVDTEC